MSITTKQNKKELVRELNKLNILNAAEELFSKLGYDGASISMIAQKADLPKANVHYYFKNKDNLYEAVLQRIISNWNLGLDDVTVDDEPAKVLHKYIKNKVKLAINKPLQSRLFASEIIRGAPYLADYLRKNTRPWVRAKCQLFQDWIDANKMDKVDPHHLLFLIWSTTQYYADYQAEVLLVQNKLEYEENDVTQITHSITSIILKGIGLAMPKNVEDHQ
ncbi:TetR/AcrR family transcriptional regulator [Paraglaciecola aquimarina]|uniref:TetR/AcrR family transcriptional regulator n=1 Tax=Paraglaciecola aquimarina TaxID=1235557 RepID=A0ABU3SYQ4_9ALTE|nr:TetR/AcrR family transcriptional regulator [Paraglaciecola aquimarina]MDU0355047.1 TetR/AcrR family transcriptional regulator [Paraglaciecola aquimarina]